MAVSRRTRERVVVAGGVLFVAGVVLVLTGIHVPGFAVATIGAMGSAPTTRAGRDDA